MSQTWSDVRRSARKVEGQLDTKLNQYLKAAGELQPHADVEGGAGPMAAGLERDIERLLSQLGETTDEMCKLAASVPDRLETYQRYQGVFHQFTSEFRRTRQRIESNRKRSLLLGSGPSDAGGGAGSGRLRPQEALGKESEGLLSSLGLTDQLINSARSNLSRLRTQRGMFSSMSDRLVGLANQFPVARDFMRKITNKRNRDNLILAAVIACLMFFTVLYMSYQS